MRLHILFDLHLEHSFFEMPPVESDVLILAGDILTPGHRALGWAAREAVHRGRAVVQVAGNHEFYREILQAEHELMRKAAKRPGHHLLDRSSAVLGGVRFLGCILWTNYRVPIIDATGRGMRVDPAQGMAACAAVLTDHRVIKWQDGVDTKLLTPENLLGEHQTDRQWLEQQLAAPFDGPTVVVTHHAPHPLSIAPRFASDWATSGFASALPDSFFEVPVLWIHGHTHTRFDYRVGNCRVVCNPRGYLLWGDDFEVDDFDPALVIEVNP